MLKTEMRNPKSINIDKMQTSEMVKLICEENHNAVKAVEKASDMISKAVDAITESIGSGGKLYFIGAGTSGRLGVLDAAECPPTFGVPYDLVTGIIAGGRDSMFKASEGAEDSGEAGKRDIAALVKKGDAVVGISVAGGAEYVVEALCEARRLGAVTIALTSNENTKIEKAADICIITDTGAEVITGSTRLKAGTAHKMVLNALTTCAMVKTGKVHENLMINLKPSNIKLTKRMRQIVQDITGMNEDEAKDALEKNDWNIRKAVLWHKKHANQEE